MIQQHGFRLTEDQDIFAAGDEQLDDLVQADRAALEAAGFAVHPRRSYSGFRECTVAKPMTGTSVLQWTAALSREFYAPVPDPQFGHRLHLADLAVNKALAAASRMKKRDFADLWMLDRHVMPLWRMACGAPGKDAGLNPFSVIERISFNWSMTVGRNDPSDWLVLTVDVPLEEIRRGSAQRDAGRAASSAGCPAGTLRSPPDRRGRPAGRRPGNHTMRSVEGSQAGRGSARVRRRRQRDDRRSHRRIRTGGKPLHGIAERGGARSLCLRPVRHSENAVSLRRLSGPVVLGGLDYNFKSVHHLLGAIGHGPYSLVTRLRRGKPSIRGSRASACFRGSIRRRARRWRRLSTSGPRLFEPVSDDAPAGAFHGVGSDRQAAMPVEVAAQFGARRP